MLPSVPHCCSPSYPTALLLSSASVPSWTGSHCPSLLNLGCHKTPCHSSWNKTTQSHCQTLWIHCLSEREFLTVYLFFPVTSKKSNVVPLSTYHYICQLRIRRRFSQGFAKEAQRKQCPIHTELHLLQALSLPSSSSVTELPWTCPPHGFRDTLDMLMTSIKCAWISGWKCYTWLPKSFVLPGHSCIKHCQISWGCFKLRSYHLPLHALSAKEKCGFREQKSTCMSVVDKHRLCVSLCESWGLHIGWIESRKNRNERIQPGTIYM